MAEKLQLTTAVAATLAAVASVLAVIVSGYVAYSTANRQTDVKLIEIAVGILKAKPEENIRPAREWAVHVISHYSQEQDEEISLSDAAQKALLQHQVFGDGPVGIVESRGEALPAVDNRQ